MRGRGEKKADGTGGQAEQALGRSRGGFGTKIHVAVNGLGLPVTLALTPGQAADVTQVPTLLAGAEPEVVIADKGYDSDAVVEAIEAAGAEAVIPPKKNRTVQRPYDRDRYKDRNLAERTSLHRCGRRRSKTDGDGISSEGCSAAGEAREGMTSVSLLSRASPTVAPRQ